MLGSSNIAAINQNAQDKQQKQKQFQQGLLAGAGGMGTAITAGIPDTRNRQTGLVEPNAGKSLAQGFTTGFGMGTTLLDKLIFGVIGAGAAGAMLPGQNLDYAQATSKYNLLSGMQNKNQFLPQDYTNTMVGKNGGVVNYSRFGSTSDKKVMAELEGNEGVFVTNPKTGKPQMILQTGNDIPDHEFADSRNRFMLPEGAKVIPGEKLEEAKRYARNGDTKKFDNLFQNVLLKSSLAAANNEPFSNTAGLDAQVNEMNDKTYNKFLKQLYSNTNPFSQKIQYDMDNNFNYSRFGSYVAKPKKSKMEYGGMTYNKMKTGGMLKEIPEGPDGAGLRSLKKESPETVNKMGYMQNGGYMQQGGINPYMPMMAQPMNPDMGTYNQQLFGDVMNPMQRGGMVQNMEEDVPMDQVNEMDINFTDMLTQMQDMQQMMNGGMASLMSQMKYSSKNPKMKNSNSYRYGGKKM